MLKTVIENNFEKPVRMQGDGNNVLSYSTILSFAYPSIYDLLPIVNWANSGVLTINIIYFFQAIVNWASSAVINLILNDSHDNDNNNDYDNMNSGSSATGSGISSSSSSSSWSSGSASGSRSQSNNVYLHTKGDNIQLPLVVCML